MSSDSEHLAAALGDRYHLERQLGYGVAPLYLAEDLRNHRRVVVKMLRSDISDMLDGSRFLRQMEILARLSHPNILPLYDFGKAGYDLFFVVPYLEESSLRDLLGREGRLSVSDTARIVRQLADGLSHAHDSGIIHRDIKPENVLMSGGQAVLADFGIAYAIFTSHSERLTKDILIGTPLYMSPEQMFSAGDARSDIYALGSVVYEMLTGESPHGGDAMRAATAKATAAEVQPNWEMNGVRVPPGVQAAVLKALAADPAQRFASAREFADAVEGAIADPRLRDGPERAGWRRRFFPRSS